jgi:hypothetical protein
MATTYNTPFIQRPDPGFRLADARGMWDAIVSANAVSTAYGIAAAGTTQATATQLTSVLNEVDTTAASTGVNLPSSKGLRSTNYNFAVIFNNGASNLTVYAAQGTSDTINGVAGATGISISPGSSNVFYSAKPGVWVSSSNTSFTFGAGSASFGAEGNITSQIFAATALEPSATGADNVLAAFTIPANSFNTAGKGITIQAGGSYGATANTKTVKLIFNPATAVLGSTVGSGGTTVATTGALTQSGTGWLLQADVYKFGAANSNTQEAQQLSSISGTVQAGVTAPVFPTATENAAILVAVTGNAATALSDINLNLFTINATN